MKSNSIDFNKRSKIQLRIIIFILCTISISASFAYGFSQDEFTKKFSLLGSGGMSFHSEFIEDTENSSTTINISPKLYFFVIDRVALGGVYNLTSNKQGTNNIGTTTIGPSARYYWKDKAIFTSISFLLNFHTKYEKYSYYDPNLGDYEEREDEVYIAIGGLNFSLGFNTLITNRFALEMLINFYKGSYHMTGLGEDLGYTSISLELGILSLLYKPNSKESL